MKVALLSDTHFGAKNDNQVVMDYFAAFYNDCFFPELEARGIKTIWHLGDVFDRRKFINFLTLQKANDCFLSQIPKRGLEMHVIPGNHDCYFKNTNDVNSITQLLSNIPGVTFYQAPTEVVFDGLKVLFLPWLNPENTEPFMKQVASSNATFLLAHLELAGHELHKGMPADHGMDDKQFSNFEGVFTGHYHTKSSKNDIHYLGSPYEMTWVDHDDPKGFYIFDTVTKEVEFIENTNRMHEKIYYNDVLNVYGSEDVSSLKNKMVKLIVEKKTNHAMFDALVDKINKAGPLNFTIVEDLELDVKEQEDAMKDAAKDTLTLINEYIDDIQKEIQTDPLKVIMKNLYNEAVQ